MIPRFKDMMNDVVAYGSCSACGSCVLVCPFKNIRYVDGKPQPARGQGPLDYCKFSEEVGCDVCAQACPRLYPREHHLADAVFGKDQPPRGAFGVYRRILVVRSKDPRIMDRCQDGGGVTALLVGALRAGLIDGAVVSALDGHTRCDPVPTLARTEEEIIAASGSWYTYVPNNLALEQALRANLKKVAFVGVPCQVTPLRKLEAIDPAFLERPGKKEAVLDRQRKLLKGVPEIVRLNLGLFCSETFLYEGLMVRKIEQEMGIPLETVRKFNIKGNVLIQKKDGTTSELKLKAAQEFARPECRHCADFAAELADISFGGVGTSGWTIVVIRTGRGDDVFSRLEAEGCFEIRPWTEFPMAQKILLQLSLKKKLRVPIPPGKDESFIREPQAQ
jgi:coenzyme F420 hydrogenase subunit beta